MGAKKGVLLNTCHFFLTLLKSRASEPELELLAATEHEGPQGPRQQTIVWGAHRRAAAVEFRFALQALDLDL